MVFALVSALLLAQSAAAPAGNTLTLEQALREAQARNHDLVASRARLDQARELHRKAWSYYLPQVTAAASFTHNQTPDVELQVPTAFAIRDVGAAAPGADVPLGGALPGAPSRFALVPTASQTFTLQKQDQLAAQFQVTQALLAPQAWFGISAARYGESAATESVENVRRQVLFGVAQAYYGAAGLMQVVSIQERQLAIAVAHERDARVRYEAGTAPKVTLLRAEIDRARAEQDLKRAQNGHLGAKIALATLLDRSDAAFELTIPGAPDLPSDLDALETSAPRQRPDVLAAEASVQAAERNRQGVVARYAPTVGAFARWQWANMSGFTGKYQAWALGLGLSWNLFDGGLREAELRETAARVREAEATEAGARARAIDEVKRARLERDSAMANREKAKEQLALARESQKLVDVNYRAGAATYLEVSDANAALLAAELGLVSEALSADLAGLRVLLAAGAFNPR